MKPYIPTSANPWNEEKAAHLLRRTVIGVKPGEIERAVREGFAKTVERLFTPYSPLHGFIAEWVDKEPDTYPRPEGAHYDAWYWDVVGRRTGFNQWWMQSMVEAPIALSERMTLFWHGHFTTSFSMVQHAEWMWTQHKLLRRHALGNFKQFVKDITVDVAMLWFLNGFENQKTEQGAAINENYARELMELYTMGIVNAKGVPNYTQRDVREAARSLTGWKMKPGQDDHHASLESIFYHWFWDNGEKTIFGQTGKWKALDVVDIIFSERALEVACFVCRKLYRWFVAAEDTSESESVIAQMAQTFITSNWEIAPVVRELLMSEEFFAQENIGCLPKNGIEFLVGMLRTFAITNVPDFQQTATLAERWNQNDMLLRMESLGHWLCFPVSVAGWGDGRSWLTSSSLAVRLKYATRIMKGTMLFRDDGYSCFTFDPLAFAKQFPNAATARARELVIAMATALWSIPPDDGETAILLEALLDGGADYEWRIDDIQQRPEARLRKCLVQLVSMPKFQLL